MKFGNEASSESREVYKENSLKKHKARTKDMIPVSINVSGQKVYKYFIDTIYLYIFIYICVHKCNFCSQTQFPSCTSGYKLTFTQVVTKTLQPAFNDDSHFPLFEASLSRFLSVEQQVYKLNYSVAYNLRPLQ